MTLAPEKPRQSEEISDLLELADDELTRISVAWSVLQSVCHEALAAEVTRSELLEICDALEDVLGRATATYDLVGLMVCR